jgi:hypothetical protein
MQKALRLLNHYHESSSLDTLDDDGNVVKNEPELLSPLVSIAEKKTVVWRGNYSLNKLDYLNKLDSKGYLFIDKLTSTSPDLRTAVNFMRLEENTKGSLIFKIIFYKDFPYVDLSYNLPNRLFHGEEEILLLPKVNLKKLVFRLIDKLEYPYSNNSELERIAKTAYKSDNDERSANGIMLLRPFKDITYTFTYYEIEALYV